MTRYISILIFCIFSLHASAGFTKTHSNMEPHELVFRGFAPMDFPLPPNDPQPFTNPLLWKFVGYCIVVSNYPKNPISFTIKKKKGTINNVEFLEGESFYVVAEAGQRFDLIAEGRARVEVINHGAQPIAIKCGNNSERDSSVAP